MSKNLKTVLLPFICLILFAACRVQTPATKITTPEIAPDDSIKYELIVLDPGFDSWYLQKPTPELDRSKEYFKYWNNQYVQEWNNNPGINRHFGTSINYDFSEDYPLEIEHKLYYYFRYVEEILKIPILKGRHGSNR